MSCEHFPLGTKVYYHGEARPGVGTFKRGSTGTVVGPTPGRSDTVDVFFEDGPYQGRTLPSLVANIRAVVPDPLDELRTAVAKARHAGYDVLCEVTKTVTEKTSL